MRFGLQFNLATWLTVSRFFLVPVFIYFFLIENFYFAVVTLILASLTDVLDGLLARRFNMGTKLGSVLDPLADKFLMMVSFIALSMKGAIPWWCTIIVIGRDLYIVFGLMFIYFIKKKDLVIQPSIMSKRTTFAQFLLLTLSFLKFFLINNAFDLNGIYSASVLKLQFAFIYVTACLTVITFVQYTYRGINILRYGESRLINNQLS